jgi:CRP-like cAMP-binding protein
MEIKKGNEAKAEQNKKNTTATKEPGEKKMELSVENMTKWVEEKKGIRFMVEQTGKTSNEVRTALKNAGLKTITMRNEETRRIITFTEQQQVYSAIDTGIVTEEEIADVVGMNLETVRAIVRKFKKDGVVKNALSITQRPGKVITKPNVEPAPFNL